MGKSPSKNSYEIIDSGHGKKLERFGPYIIERPCSQAIWAPKTNLPKPHATFTREGESRWNGKLPDEWVVEHKGVQFLIRPTSFGHLGLFPEHGAFWHLFNEKLKPGDKVLNLFAYTGGATLAAAKAGMQVCHVDASKPTTEWAKENAALNSLEKAPIRWIVDDVYKFLQREIRRGSHYDAIILDPPSFGRGSRGEVFKIEDTVSDLLKMCRELMPKPKLLLFSSHTPGFTPVVMERLLEGSIGGECVLKCESGNSLPLGSYTRYPK
jgi:23S rRNA (cytosine1962-C5)-methyltransferase